MHRLTIILIISLVLLATPVYAQEPTDSPEPSQVVDVGNGLYLPEGSPWWAGIALTILGAGGFLLRGYSRRLDQRQQAAIDKQREEFDAAEQEREHRHKLQIAELEAKVKADTDAGQKIGSLTAAIGEMASSNHDMLAAFMQSTAQASDERSTMINALDAQAKGITERNQLLREVGESVTHNDEKLAAIIQTLEDVRGKMGTQEVLRQMVAPLVQKIDAALKELHTMQQPDAPAETAPQSRANMVEVEAGEKE